MRAGDVIVGRDFQPEAARAVSKKGGIEIRENIGLDSIDIVGGNEGGFFAIDEFGRITMTEAGAASAANDFETGPNSFSLTVTATDTAGNTSVPQTVTMTVSDAAAALDGRLEIGRDGTVSANPTLAGNDARSAGVGAINGQAVSRGETVALPSGALVRANDDGTLTYDLNGASVSGTDSFTYAARLPTDFLDLAEVDGETGVILAGVAPNDQTGFAVSAAGDFNGDGFDDVMVSGEFSGEVSVVFGSGDRFPALLDLATLDGSNGFTIDEIGAGLIPNSFGSAVGKISLAPAGDLNNDGFDDIVIGRAFFQNEARDAVPGAAFVLFGAADGFDARIDASALDGSDGFYVAGESAEQRLGSIVSGAGDVNGDGIDDILIGEGNELDPGASTVIFGRNDGFEARFVTSEIGPEDGFRIEAGREAVIVGDINDDGLDDIFVPTFRTVSDEVTPAFVLFGSDTGFPDTVDAGDIDGSNGFILTGTDLIAETSVADVNGDGIDDLILGGRVAEWPRSGVDTFTSAYVVYGTRDGFGTVLDVTTMEASTGVSIGGIEASIASDPAVSGIDDFNGDGIDDIAIGSRFAELSPEYAGNGLVAIFFGKAGGLDEDLDFLTLDPGDGLLLPGIEPLDFAGRSVSSAGDVNNDGFGDLLVGAEGASGISGRDDDTGEAFIVFGRPNVSLPGLSDEATVRVVVDLVRTGDGGDNFLRGGPGNDVLSGRSGRDILAGGEGRDALYGGFGDDGLRGGGGDDLMRGGGNNDLLFGERGQDVLLGNDGHDALYGGKANDKLFGGSGVDRLFGNDGRDVLKGDRGNDQLFGGRGKDRLDGGGGDDMIWGGPGNDVLSGRSGRDILAGGEGRDALYGGFGDDGLRGGGGDDLMRGGGNNDLLFGERGQDVLLGNDGHDALYGGKANDKLFGGSGVDRLFGNDGRDVLKGDRGNDQLFGGRGKDRLDGGAGSDWMKGGNGADIFIFNSGKDIILDYRSEDLVEIERELLGNGNDLGDHVRFENGDLVLDFGKDELTFQGLNSLSGVDVDLV